MSILTFSQAIRAAGVARSTIYRYVKEGKLSATCFPDGRRGIDTAELERVFGSLQSFDISQTIASKQSRTAKKQPGMFEGRDEIVELLRQQVQMLERELTDAKAEKAKLLGLLEQRLLESAGKRKKKGKRALYRLVSFFPRDQRNFSVQ